MMMKFILSALALSDGVLAAAIAGAAACPALTITEPGKIVTVTGPPPAGVPTVTSVSIVETTVAGPPVTVTVPCIGDVVIKTATSTITGLCATSSKSVAVPTTTPSAQCTPSIVTVTGGAFTITQPGIPTAKPVTIVSTLHYTIAGGKTVLVTATCPPKSTTTTTIIETVQCHASSGSPPPVSSHEPTTTPPAVCSTVTETVTVTKTETGPTQECSASSGTTSTSSSSSACPIDNIPTQEFQFPHLIIPISSANPDVAYGTSFDGSFNSTVSTIFNFDIPADYTGNTCTLSFLLPQKSSLITSTFTMSGAGGIDVSELSAPATSGTTYDNAPAVKSDLGTFEITEGSSTVIAAGPCAAGETVAYEVKATAGLDLTYFQDWNAPAIGLWITTC